MEFTPGYFSHLVRRMGSWTRGRWVAEHLAAALAAGSWTTADLEARTEAVVGPSEPDAIRAFVAELIADNPSPYAPPPERLRRMILASSSGELAFERILQNYKSILPILAPQPFAPVGAFGRFDHRPISTSGDLAAWLGLSIDDLDFFADARRRQSRTDAGSLQHYTYAWLPKRRGPPRLLEAPKSRLKMIQRRILRDILDAVPAHPAAHGFVRGRSCISAASPHAGEPLVITLDLKDFFLTTPLARVHGIFRTLGYSSKVARHLTSLCSMATPPAVFVSGSTQPWTTRKAHLDRHLPQGAPTSPILANLCCFRLDARLTGFAKSTGLRYTRYADDLVFSGEHMATSKLRNALRLVSEIVADEGYAINHAKTKIQPKSSRQSIMGMVVNAHTNMARDDYDTLKAILFNCQQQGPASQNRSGHPEFRSHLDGRVNWVEQLDPKRGAKLRSLFDRIVW